ncbi:MAG: PTS sugar transporter subunit IIA [Candidatus Cloacimonetes bacterium]|nr:PTS sugar transporter subunit IIA [Candidatus Cloacimonadota bacterium]
MPRELITLTEASNYLKLSKKIVTDMIDQGVFSQFPKGKTFRVDKNEINEWLSNLSESQNEQLALRRTACRFMDYFSTDFIMLDFKVDNKYEAIGEMSKLAKDVKLVRNQRWLYEVVVAREELISTAIGNGVALLHPRRLHPSKIKSPSILFGRSTHGVDFDSPDNKPVNLFFMLLLHNDKQHLFSLSYISKFLSNSDNLQLLLDSTDKKEIFDKLTAV